jgi:hypothetical protein
MAIGRQRVGRRALDRVGPLASRFGDDIASCVDHVRVVPKPADQRVDAGSAV